MDRHVAEDNILVSDFKYFIVFFHSILKIFLYLRRLFKFLTSVLSIIPATPQRESLQGGRGLLFCSCHSGCNSWTHKTLQCKVYSRTDMQADVSLI
jgi:hypothetical protein